jgi:hypothetical protein
VARIRSVKPELRDSALVASWPFAVRYFWVLLWGYLDDYGRGLDFPKRIAGDCFPSPDDDIDAKDVDSWLNLMSVGQADEQGPVCRYEVGGKRYIHCVNWSEHQKPNRPTPSRIPPCPFHESLTEPLNGDSVPGAAEQGSRGAEEQQQQPRESCTEGDIRIVQGATDATADEAALVVAAVVAEGRHRNLGAFLRKLATDGDLAKVLHKIRTDAAKADTKRAMAAARTGPECEHRVPGGASPHPESGEPICPNCRTAQRSRGGAHARDS